HYNITCMLAFNFLRNSNIPEKLILFQADLIEQLCYLLAIASIFAYLTQEEEYEKIVEIIALSLIASLVLITITTSIFIFSS
ncbi:MAG: hypothetical protein ACO2PO_08595, partial [Candidatus Calescibacterium sp.]